jgi:flavin reductase (DIM6/NTAB) family NADH-FMN oxidoreductase RutF
MPSFADASMTVSTSTPETFAHFELGTMPKGDVYKLLAATILPRPIAWVVSRDAHGCVNAAPFSFFNILASDPPIVAIGFSSAPDREGKDTLANIRATGEFVINLVPEELASEMNITATNAPRGTDETQLAGLEMASCALLDVPRIAASPVALECQLWQEVDPGGSSTIVLAKVIYAHVRESAFLDVSRLHIDTTQLRLIGRMAGTGGYTTTKDLFEIDRKAWPAPAK